MTDGYEETLAVVRAIREYTDAAKRNRPQHAEAIERLGLDAMALLWRINADVNPPPAAPVTDAGEQR